MTSRFILTLLNLLRLRSGPQDMPGGWPIAAIASLACVSQGFMADSILGDTDGVPRSLLAVGVQFGVIAVLLNFRNQASRLPQTLTAMAGTGFIFGLLSLAILTRIVPGESTPDLALMYLGLFAWSLVVDAHIYRHALSIRMPVGVLLAVLIFAATFSLLKAVFG